MGPLTPGQYAVPDDGDAAAATSWDVATESIGDRVAYLLDQIRGAADRRIIIA